MRIDIKKLADAVVAAAEGKTPAQVKSLMKDVVQLLHEERMLGKWRVLERSLEHAWAARYGVAKVTVVSAHPLSAAVHEALEQHAKGADVEEIVDDRLIAGAIVRMDNTRIDGSVTGALMRLKNAMYSEV